MNINSLNLMSYLFTYCFCNIMTGEPIHTTSNERMVPEIKYSLHLNMLSNYQLREVAITGKFSLLHRITNEEQNE